MTTYVNCKRAAGKLVLTLALCVGASGYLEARATEVLNPPIQATTGKKAKKSKAAKGVKSSKAKFSSGSEETRKERDSRLKRECKGQVNAGACAGYTR